MNLKKFISAVSALTIVASAFAVMAVTASAASGIDATYTANDKTLTWKGNNDYGNIGKEGKTWSLDNDFADITLVSKNSIWHPVAGGIVTCGRSMVYSNGGKNNSGMYGYITVTPKYSGTLTLAATVADSGGNGTRNYTTTFYAVEGTAESVVIPDPKTGAMGSITVKGNGGSYVTLFLFLNNLQALSCVSLYQHISDY